MGLCHQKQYAQLSYEPKNKPVLFEYNPSEEKFNQNIDAFLEYNNKKKLEEDQKFAKFFSEQEKKKQEEDKKFAKFFQDQQRKKQEALKNRKPNQTEMAKVIYAYMRLYGYKPDDKTRKFVEENYNDSYRSETYLLNSSIPTITYRYEVMKRLETAHENRWLSWHQTFNKADEKNRTIEYEWTVRHQLTNELKVYDCKATFDEKNRFLTLTLRQLDRYVHRPAPSPPKKEQTYKHSWEKPSNNYYPPPTDWNAHYNAQVQRSNDQFRQNMNKQAQQWNNYVQQKNARGW